MMNSFKKVKEISERLAVIKMEEDYVFYTDLDLSDLENKGILDKKNKILILKMDNKDIKISISHRKILKYGKNTYLLHSKSIEEISDSKYIEIVIK